MEMRLRVDFNPRMGYSHFNNGDRHDMDIQGLITKITDIAKDCQLDAEANELYRLADRVAHQGALFEKPLTDSELAMVKRLITI